MNTLTRSLAGLTGIGVAVGLAYLFDPDNGKQRRSRLGSQCKKAASRVGDGTHAVRDGITHRYHDASARMVSWYDARKNPDRDLKRRIRMELARAVAHPGAIGVIAHDDMIILHGDVVAGEHERVLQAVRGVQGVGNVADHLAEIPVARPDRIGARIRQGLIQTRDDLAQPHWSPPARVGSGAVGLALIRFGATHRNIYGGLGALFGAALITRSIFNTPLRQLGSRAKDKADAAVERSRAAMERDGNSRERVAQPAYAS